MYESSNKLTSDSTFRNSSSLPVMRGNKSSKCSLAITVSDTSASSSFDSFTGANPLAVDDDGNDSSSVAAVLERQTVEVFCRRVVVVVNDDGEWRTTNPWIGTIEQKQPATIVETNKEVDLTIFTLRYDLNVERAACVLR